MANVTLGSNGYCTSCGNAISGRDAVVCVQCGAKIRRSASAAVRWSETPVWALVLAIILCLLFPIAALPVAVYLFLNREPTQAAACIGAGVFGAIMAIVLLG